MLYSRRGSRDISDIPENFYENDLAMRYADVTGGKPIAVWYVYVNILDGHSRFIPEEVA
jgi:hypothetical protein